MTLSYSRMKFAYFSVDPFDAKATIDGHIAAFRYFGGRIQMIVYDQDKTMVVSENLVNVIFVKEFEDFIKETGFTISSSEVIKRKNLLNSRVYREIGGFSFEYFSVHSTAFTV